MADQKVEVFEPDDWVTAQDEAAEVPEAKDEERDRLPTDVIEEQIEPSRAFQTFAGKVYDPTQPADNSSKKRRYEREYAAPSARERQFESPLMKYKRLKNEISKFESELNELSQKCETESVDATKLISEKLNKDLGEMWSSVENLKNLPHLNALFSDDTSALQTVPPEYLFDKLKQYEANSQTESKDDNAKNAVLTLFHNANVNTKSFQLSELDQRLLRLEKILGPAPEAPKVGDMLKSIDYLNKRLELLSNESQLEKLVQKSQRLRKELQFSNSKKQHNHEDQIMKRKEEKIDEMFDMMHRWDEAATQLPTVCTRLRSLKTLHQESANAVSKVNALDTQHRVIQETLESNKKMLETVKSSFANTAKTMLENLESMEQRIKALSDKM